MKLLGKFSSLVSTRYQEILEQEGINGVIEDTSNVYSRAKGGTMMSLLVPDDDYDRAVSLIKNFETHAASRVKDEAKNLDRVMLKIFIFFLLGIAVFLALVFYKELS